MSTKTTFKRISLVTVVALATALLSSAPSNAAITAFGASKTNASPASTITAPTSVGTAVTADLNVITTGNSAAAVTVGLTWALVDPNGTDVTADVTFANTGLSTGITSSTFVGAVDTVVIATSTNAATLKVGTMQFTPKMAGRYTLRVTQAASTGEVVAAAAIADVTTPYFYVSGSGSVVSVSGVGTTTIGAVSGGQAVVRFGTAAHASGDIYNLTSSGVGTIQTTADGASAPAARAGIAGASDYSQGAKITTTANTNFNDVLVTVASTTAGTQTLTWTAISATTGAPTVVATQAITWGAAPALAATSSTAYIQAGVGANSATSDATVTASKTAGDVANIAVTLKDSNGSAFTGQKLTVTVDGPGLIGVDVNSVDGVTAGRTNRIYADSSANAGNVWQIGIASDGTAGTGRFTISVGTTVIAVKSVTFYGSVAKLTASAGLIATANGSSTTDAVVVCAADASGNAVPAATIYASSGDTSVASVAATGTTVSSAVTEDVDTGSAGTALVPTAYQAAKAIGCAGFAVTGASQTLKDSVTLTFRDASTAADATVSTTATVNVGAVKAASVVLSSDKASYAAGAKGTITLTFKDSTGRLVGAGAGTGTLDAVLTSSASLQGAALFATANNTYKGVASADVYFPWNAGTVVISGKTGTNSTYLDSTVQGLALSKSITVTAAADSTSAQIASLIKKINDLSKLIAKIQKKLGVK